MRSISLVTLTLLVVSLFHYPPSASGARILCLFPVPSKSHLIVFSALTKELAKRGHELVVASPFPLDKPPANFTNIDLMPSMKELYEEMMGMDLYELGNVWNLEIPMMFWNEGITYIELTFSVPEIKQLLDDKRGFDLVIVEDFVTDAFYAFADYFKAPLILISSLGGLHSTNYAVGNPLELAYAPNNMLQFTAGQMSFLERLENVIFTAFWDLGAYLYCLPRQEALRKEFFGDTTRSIWELKYTPSLVLLNSHFSLNFPRPQLPSIQEVGGMQVTRAIDPLPKDIQDFLDGAKDGAVYFSMGSNLRSNFMPASMKEGLIAAFSEIPHRVLMRWDDETLPGNPPNIKCGKWLPQQGILAHPNVRVFITHGGLLSATESAYYGVPLVGIPVFADQMLNIRKAAQEGYAIMLEMKNVTKQSVLWALDKTLYDKSIIQNARTRSKIFRDQPETPLERAVFWTEYVLRHNGAPHLRSGSLNLTWYQRNLLDVTALVLVFGLALVCAVRFSFRMCCKSSKQSTNSRKKRD